MSKHKEYIFHAFVVSLLKKLQLSGYDFIFFHVPNGEKRDKSTAGKLKMMGVLAGIPDITLLYKGGTSFLEFKTDAGKPSPVQLEFKEKADSYGHKTYVIYAENVKEGINSIIPVLSSVLGIDQNEISSISAKVIETSIGMFGLGEKS